MQPHIITRPLTGDDAPALQAACWPALSVAQARQRVARALARARRDRAWPVVGLCEGRVVGFGQLVRWRGGVEVGDLVVGSLWRRRGVGTAIVTHLLDLAREWGFAWVEVGVAESNAPACALYRRLGFNRRERRLLLDLGQGPEPIIYLSQVLSEPRE